MGVHENNNKKVRRRQLLLSICDMVQLCKASVLNILNIYISDLSKEFLYSDSSVKCAKELFERLINYINKSCVVNVCFSSVQFSFGFGSVVVRVNCESFDTWNEWKIYLNADFC